LKIIQNKDNLKPGELASTFGLLPSTISTIIGNKEKIQEYFQQKKIDESRKRIRVPNYKSI
jgi:plasmid maintenance system antidote protein VapI